MYALSPSPDPVYETVIVPVEKIIEREPDTVRTFIDRIVYVKADPIITARAPGGAMEQVQEFCRPIVVAQTDTVVGSVDPMLLLRSVSYDRRWGVKKDRLLLTGPTNVGDLMAFDYVVRGDWTVSIPRSSPLVQYPRTSLVYDVWESGTQIFAVIKLGEFIYNTLAN